MTDQHPLEALALAYAQIIDPWAFEPWSTSAPLDKALAKARAILALPRPGDATGFCWLIEAPGQNYLGTRTIGHHPDFYWTREPEKAVRLFSEAQADGVMMAVRQAFPSLWAFAVNLGEARPVEHGWLAKGATP